MYLRAFAFLALVAAIPALLTAQDVEGAAGTRAGLDSLDVLGVVLDADTRDPVEGVAVTVRPTSEQPDSGGRSRVAETDGEGRFFFRSLADGRYRIEMERLGYRTLVDSVAYSASLGLRIQAQLVPEALTLEPLLVAVEARSRHLEASGFYRRQARGLGRFITRDDIEERNPMEVTDLMRTIPGVRIRRGRGIGGQTVVLMRGGCVAEVYLDGARTIPPFPLDSSLHPNDVDGIEVYHASELPAQYGTTPCGALLVWTRLPEPDELGNPFTLRRTLAALGIVGVVLFLIR